MPELPPSFPLDPAHFSGAQNVTNQESSESLPALLNEVAEYFGSRLVLLEDPSAYQETVTTDGDGRVLTYSRVSGATPIQSGTLTWSADKLQTLVVQKYIDGELYVTETFTFTYSGDYVSQVTKTSVEA